MFARRFNASVARTTLTAAALGLAALGFARATPPRTSSTRWPRSPV
jgi:hypothetical protein